jgi:hypothetical protein
VSSVPAEPGPRGGSFRVVIGPAFRMLSMLSNAGASRTTAPKLAGNQLTRPPPPSRPTAIERVERWPFRQGSTHLQPGCAVHAVCASDAQGGGVPAQDTTQWQSKSAQS